MAYAFPLMKKMNIKFRTYRGNDEKRIKPKLAEGKCGNVGGN